MTQPVCVAAVPGGHPYVARVLDHESVTVLPDPPVPGAPTSQWWPPVILTREWLTDHRDDADVVHVHFGTESYTPAQLQDALTAARENAWPLVVTVHDLVHPQLVDQEPYRRQLDLLIPAADRLITLTAGAAREIEARWGRVAVVLPHPRLLPDQVEPPIGLRRTEPLVGMHLKDLRPNVDGVSATEALLAAVALLRERGLRVGAEIRLHHRVRDERQRDRIRALCEHVPAVVLLEHERLDDAGLAHSLAHLDACVLPYRFGTHSGWLELCWDLGVPVAAPRTGYYLDQHDDPTIVGYDLEPDGVSLADALANLLAAGTATGTPERRALVTRRLDDRLRADRATAVAHADLYRELLSPGSAR